MVSNKITEETAQLILHARKLFNNGDYVGVYDAVQSVLESGKGDQTLARLAILSLARSGAPNQAIDLFYKLKPMLPENEETLTLKARLFKDNFLHCNDKKIRLEQGIKARDTYLQAYKIRRHYYPGINAATLSFLIDDIEMTDTLAKEVAGICEKLPLSKEESYYSKTGC